MRKSASIIRIPQPCHERWEAMTPENNGRFCDSCEKVVVDFTGKTDLEIQAILRANAGNKTCGRFKTSQFDRPLNITIDSEAVRRTANPRMVFVAALLLVFGTTLFSCHDHQDKMIGIALIEIKTLGIEENGEEPKDTVAEFFDLLGEVIVEAPSPDAPSTSSTNNDSLLNAEAELSTGEMPCVRTGDNDPPPDPENNSKDSIVTETVEIEYVLGMVVSEHSEDEIAPPISEEVADPLIQSAITQFENEDTNHNHSSVAPEMTVYPNPSNGEFFVRYTVKDRCDVFLELLDQQGKSLMQIVDIKSQHNGEYHIPVDLSSFSPNLYLLQLRLGEKIISSRIVVQR